MKKILAATMGMAFLSSASAASLDDMVGTWDWEGYTIEVTKCDATNVCSKVTAGPKNVGLEMMKSKIAEKDGAFVGQVAHPMTGMVYNAKMTMKDGAWHMDGCTDAGACASGKFSKK